MEKFGEGHNIVVSTGTASGKSLIFRVAAFHATLLDPSFRVLAFYPLKALANDQLKGWRQLARELELDERVVGRIDGSVPMKERDEILEHARILICTPDVCHAWLMSRLSIPVVKSFIRHVGLIIMDEAHTLEGVFGSNFAFLLRRLMTARRQLLESKDSEEVRLIAALQRRLPIPSSTCSYSLGRCSRRSRWMKMDRLGQSACVHMWYRRRAKSFKSPAEFRSN